MAMRKIPSLRITTLIALAAAILGLALSMVGLISLWLTRDDVTRQIQEITSLSGRTLLATQEMLQVAGRTLDQADKDLEMIAVLMADLGTTLENSSGMITSTAELVGEDLVGFVDKTQTSLQSVEQSAQVVDDFLRLLNAVPFLGGRYRPEVPLQESFSRVNDSMDPLPEAFEKIRADLDRASTQADTLRMDVEALGQQVGEIQTGVTDAREVLDAYTEILADTQTHYDAFQSRLMVWVNIAYLGLTFFLVWVFLSQLAVMMQAIVVLSIKE
jgi:methyl-accepting chemotaxis protein